MELLRGHTGDMKKVLAARNYHASGSIAHLDVLHAHASNVCGIVIVDVTRIPTTIERRVLRRAEAPISRSNPGSTPTEFVVMQNLQGIKNGREEGRSQ